VPPGYSIAWVDVPFIGRRAGRCWLAGWVLLKIVYLLMRCLFGLPELMFCGDQARDTELLVLWHENAVLRRHTGCGTSRATAPGSLRWHGSSHAGAGPKSFL
jgi:hypothetical protein